MSVGSFPNMRDLNRRTIRGPVNPLDKSTIVSVYPRPIKFKNVTLSPGRWYMPPGDMETPSILVIGPSSWFRDVGLDEPLIEIMQSSVQIAEALVKDYLNGVFACNMHDSMPGLFFVPGKMTLTKIKEEYSDLLGNAVRCQLNYYRTLVKYADSLWARSNGNPLAVNDEMRMAARALGLRDKDWMKDHVSVGMVPCFACGEFKNPNFPICKTCHTVDPNHPLAGQVRRIDPNQLHDSMPASEAPKPENPFGNVGT